MRAASRVSTSPIATASDLQYALARPTAPRADGHVVVYARDEADATDIARRLRDGGHAADVDVTYRRTVVVLA